MAVEPLLATRAQRAFIVTSECVKYDARHSWLNHSQYPFVSIFADSLCVLGWMITFINDAEAIVVLVMVGITFRMVSSNFVDIACPSNLVS